MIALSCLRLEWTNTAAKQITCPRISLSTGQGVFGSVKPETNTHPWTVRANRFTHLIASAWVTFLPLKEQGRTSWECSTQAQERGWYSRNKSREILLLYIYNMLYYIYIFKPQSISINIQLIITHRFVLPKVFPRIYSDCFFNSYTCLCCYSPVPKSLYSVSTLELNPHGNGPHLPNRVKGHLEIWAAALLPISSL